MCILGITSACMLSLYLLDTAQAPEKAPIGTPKVVTVVFKATRWQCCLLGSFQGYKLNLIFSIKDIL